MKITFENKKYLIHVCKYLGVALIAGSVVHVGTLDSGAVRYSLLGVVGLILMMIGNVSEAKQEGNKIDANYLLILTGLSVATGFMSGGIQHYLDNPVYAGYLLAIGLFVSYITFFLKDKIKLDTKSVIIVFVFSINLILVSNFVIKDLASNTHSSLEGLETPVHGH